VKTYRDFITELQMKLDIGDEILVGKFKNRKARIKGFTRDEHGQPVAHTDRGDQKILKPRVSKYMPQPKA